MIDKHFVRTFRGWKRDEEGSDSHVTTTNSAVSCQDFGPPRPCRPDFKAKWSAPPVRGSLVG
jgi:hypothetical protein